MYNFRLSSNTLAFGFFVVLAFALFASSGCNDVCNLRDSRCDGNRIYVCSGSDVEKNTAWEFFRDCSDFDAICTEGVYTKYLDPNWGERRSVGISSTNHSCVTSDYMCNEYEGYYCTEENRYVVNCTMFDGKMVAAIGVDNWKNLPYCVDRGPSSTFAFADGTCEDGDERCDDEGRWLTCIEETWQWGNSNCDVGK